LSVVLASACSSTDKPKPSGPTGPVARFNVSGAMPGFMEVPYPSDVYLANGRIAPLPGIDTIVHAGSDYLTHELSRLDGFSRIAMTHYYVDDLDAPANDDGSPQAATIDPSTLPSNEAACQADGSAVFLVDLDGKMKLPCRASLAGWQLSKTRPLVAVGPARGFVLDGGHHYATVLTNRVKTADGKPIQASADFKKLLGGDKSVPVSGVYAPALDAIKAAIGSLDAVVAVAPYTTHTMDSELYGLRDQLESAPAPTLKWTDQDLAPMGNVKFGTGLTASLDDLFGVVDAKNKLSDGTDDPDELLPVRAHDMVAAIGTAVFDATNYLLTKPMGYQTLDHATFARDGSGKIIPAPDKPTNKIWVTFAIPKSAMPAGGYPVVIVQHGLSSSRLYMASLANTFCKNGWAVAAIDSVTFGARAPDPMYQVDAKSEWESAPGAKYKGPDGFADEPLNGSDNLFGGLKNIGALRDQFRQAEFDTTQLVHLLRSSPVLDPLKTGATSPKLDGAHIAYMGDSLGGIQGAVAASIEPYVSAWILNVAGGGVVQELAARAPGIYSLLALAGAFNFGFYNDQLTEGHIMVDIVQTIAELGDPLIYARSITQPHKLAGMDTKPRNVLQIEVIFDELVTNEADEALARAAGYPLAKPNVGSNAELFDFGKPARGVPLLEAAPDAMGGIHDIPVMGTTAVVIQDSPAGHGANFVRSKAQRQWRAPYALFGTTEPFHHFDPPDFYDVRTGYRELQVSATAFIADAFAGKAPVVKIGRPAVRDLDDDGNPDSTDPNPNDPRIK
jgi:hypothetical protein